MSQIFNDGTVLNELRNPLNARMAFNIVQTWPRERLENSWKEFRHKPLPAGWVSDVLERACVDMSTLAPKCERAIVCFGGENVVPMLLQWMEFLFRFGAVPPDVQVVIFAVDGAFEALAASPHVGSGRVHLVRCKAMERESAALKGLVYSLARFVSASFVLALEADMFVVDELAPLWELIERAPPSHLLGVRPIRYWRDRDLFLQTFDLMNLARDSGEWLLGKPFDNTAYYPMNGGLLAGTLEAFEGMDAGISTMGARARAFIENGVNFADEIVANVFISDRAAFTIVPDRYNTQMKIGPEGEVICDVTDPAILHLTRLVRPELSPLLPQIETRADLSRLGFKIE